MRAFFIEPAVIISLATWIAEITPKQALERSKDKQVDLNFKLLCTTEAVEGSKKSLQTEAWIKRSISWWCFIRRSLEPMYRTNARCRNCTSKSGVGAHPLCFNHDELFSGCFNHNPRFRVRYEKLVKAEYGSNAGACKSIKTDPRRSFYTYWTWTLVSC